MPIYDYRCTGCGHEFELRQGFDADPIEGCPVCNSESRRRFHSVAVIYKGSGFYTTDYARKNMVPAGESEDKPAESTPTPAPATATKEPESSNT